MDYTPLFDYLVTAPCTARLLAQENLSEKLPLNLKWMMHGMLVETLPKLTLKSELEYCLKNLLYPILVPSTKDSRIVVTRVCK